MIKLTTASIAAVAMAAVMPMVSANSQVVNNHCNIPVWVHDVLPNRIVRLDPGQSRGDFTANGPGVALNFFTGCDDDSAVNCRTGGLNSAAGQKPFMRAESAFNQNGIPLGYNISPLYGYNMPIKMSSPDTRALICNIQQACPVYGTDMSCYSPCCASADGCLGVENCPNDPALGPGNNHGAPGVHTDFYHSVCPNAYSFADDGSAAGHYIYSSGQSTDLTIDLCTSEPSSNWSL
ncbi:Osmotin, thaumatin-like protein [Violaceomyces palustris]|uniref:Osmotin, thaumatin-like protein n=1 Tax=Violaceomyces palustris TaxID=1673888 RepID=A0ACD0NU37_9BASI|nr:Osmotin, thaumatin-like protein [Violaceomyces palustris]